MKRLLALASLIVFTLLTTVSLLAQDTGAITGTVKDNTGAIIPGAQVEVTSSAGGQARTTTSNGDGDYLAAGLPGGTYDLKISAKGFKTFEAKGVALRVGQKARVDAALAPGAVTTEVVVQGENVNQVETESSELAGVVTGKQATQLELNGRNFTQLVQLTPGTTNQSGADEPDVGLATVAYSVNGGRTEYNAWQVDGGSNQDDGSNTTLQVYPSIDSIAEFRVLTSNYGAQYGRNGSGTVEIETKSGTSAFHGDVYEFVRNDAFNARNYFQPTVPSYKKNDYGYTIGGPIYIPNHYNTDKQKTFFFWSQEWRKSVIPTPFNQPVPSLAERGGNFSDLCPNPTTGSMSDCPINPATGKFFPGNIVPIAPQAVPLIAEIPTPTSGVPGNELFQTTTSTPDDWREELLRLDHNINSKNHATFRYIHDSWDNTFPTPLWSSCFPCFPTIQTNVVEPGISMVAHLTTEASPTLLNEFVMAYSADHISATSTGTVSRTGTADANVGFPGFNNAGRLPGISLSGGIFNGITQDVGWVPNGPVNSNPQWEYRDNISKIIGKHNLQFGGYFLASQKNELPQLVPSVNGLFTFSTGNPASTDNAFADMLLGQIQGFQQGNGQPKYYLRYKIFEPYLQDDWHVTQRLTLNLGLRMSLYGTVSDVHRIAYNFDPTAYVAADAPKIDPTTGALIAGSGNPWDGLVQCGGKGGPFPVPGFPNATAGGNPNPGCMKGHLWNPAPRIGFAWDPTGTGHTAIRGGYGVFFEHTNGNEAVATALEGSTPFVQNPLQSNINQQGVVPGYSFVGTPGLIFPSTVTSIQQKAIWPYVQQWHLDIQHDFWKNTVATISYVGSKGTHLGRRLDLNQIHPVAAGANPYVPGEAIGPNDCATGFTSDGVPIPGYSTTGLPTPGTPGVNMFVACGGGPNGLSIDAVRPFLGFSDIRELDNGASSIYHALQTQVRRTMGALQLSFAYTYSHSIDDSSSGADSSFLDSYNPSSNRASSNFDQRHVFAISYIYDLPFFKANNGWMHTAFGGWEWSGITNIQTGIPFTVTNAGANSIPSDNAGVANGIGTGSLPDILAAPTGNPATGPVGGCGPNGNIGCFGPLFFNPTLLVAPQGLTFGDEGRNRFRNPRQTNFDMGFFKSFPIHESIGLQFRAEAFNVFNHTEWGYVAGGSGSAGNNSPVSAFNNAAFCYGAGNNAGDPSCLSSGEFRPTAAHNPRILQLGLKLLF